MLEWGVRTGCQLCISVSFRILLVECGSGENILALGNTHQSLLGRWGVSQPLSPTRCKEKGPALYSQPFSKFVIILKILVTMCASGC